MNQMIAACGLDCAKCPALIATQTNDDELRNKTAREWSEMFKGDIRPEMINCEGCMTPGSVRFAHCSQCTFRACALDKKLDNCARCADYACEGLLTFFSHVPEAKTNLDKIRE